MPHTRRLRRHLLAFFLFVMLVAVAGWFFFFPMTGTPGTCIYLRPGTEQTDLRAALETAARAPQRAAFRLLADLAHYNGHERAGRYRLDGVGALNLLRNLRNGQQEPLRLSVPLVWTPMHLAKRLGDRLAADSAAFAKAFADTALLAELGCTPAGVFNIIIPDTYELYWTVTPGDFLRRMKRESAAFWTEARRSEAERQGLTPNQVVALASIVEKETADGAEKPRIAGLYLNRLRQGIRLQADPTVKFAVGDFGLRRILNSHLSTPSPYNTYLVSGLPPAPICLPSRESIEAVLSAEQHNYIYMCAREDFSGTHRFAETYAEHQQNARRYVAALNQRGIK
ncbi:MAG: endolytic transglycosylase MltG [Alloprevotella sp.]|nr:endolytic transglycosylase MltG [Alloprevotella sp.]